MSVKKSTIEAKMRLERENEKIEASKIKTVDYYEENLRILGELAYLVHENHDKPFTEIYEEYLFGL